MKYKQKKKMFLKNFLANYFCSIQCRIPRDFELSLLCYWISNMIRRICINDFLYIIYLHRVAFTFKEIGFHKRAQFQGQSN